MAGLARRPLCVRYQFAPRTLTDAKSKNAVMRQKAAILFGKYVDEDEKSTVPGGVRAVVEAMYASPSSPVLV